MTVSQSGRARRAGLGRSFRSFLAGQSLNGLGTMVATVALPLVAVERLHATVFDVGILEAVEWVPAMTIGLPVGALIDRHQHRARLIMMGANLGQAAAVAAVPASAATGVLTLAVLLTAAFTAGLFGTFFQTGYSPTYASSSLPTTSPPPAPASAPASQPRWSADPPSAALS